MPLTNFIIKYEKHIAHIAIVVILLALIRHIIEIFRLQSISDEPLLSDQIRLYLIGGILSGIGLLIMLVLSFYQKYKLVAAVAVLTLVALLVIKFVSL